MFNFSQISLTRTVQNIPGPTHFWWLCAYQLNTHVIRSLSPDFGKKMQNRVKFFLYCSSHTRRVVDVLHLSKFNLIVLLHFDISFLIHNTVFMFCFCCKFDHLLMVLLQKKKQKKNPKKQHNNKSAASTAPCPATALTSSKYATTLSTRESVKPKNAFQRCAVVGRLCYVSERIKKIL